MTDELTACREALAEARRELAAAWASARAHEQLCSEQYDRAEKAEATVAEQETVIAQVWDALFDLSSRTRPQWRTPDLWLLVSELQAILVAARKMKG